MARAADAVLQFDFARYARLAGIRPTEWIVHVLLACGTAASDACMLTLLIPLGSSVSGGAGIARFWTSSPIARLLPKPPDATAGFLWLAALLFVLALVKSAFAHTQLISLWRLRASVSERVANLLFARYLSFGKAWFDRNSAGHAAVVLDYRTDLGLVFGGLLRIASNLLLLAAYLVVMVLISWRLALVAALLLPAVSLVMRSMLERTSAEGQTAREATGQIGAQLHEVLAAMPLYQAAGQQARASREFAATVKRLYNSALRMGRFLGLTQRIQEISGLAALVVMLALALESPAVRSVAPGLLLVFFFVARMSLPVLAAFPETILDIAERLPRCRALLEVFDDAGKFSVTGGVREFETLRHAVEIRNLTFAYPGGQPALRDVTFAVDAGGMTALVGPSGSGKTTITSLLMRFYDVPAGAIFIDGTDIRDFSIDSLRRGLAIVSQDVVLLSGTLRSNLLFGVERDVPAAELDAVIDDARLRDVMSTLSGGLDGGVGERGARLSGGQRQRVAIARALLRRSSLLMLDEATSGLDAITEALVRDAVANAARHMTTLVITHRLATIRQANHVIVLNEGSIVQRGSVESLVAADGLFRQMVERQQFQ